MTNSMTEIQQHNFSKNLPTEMARNSLPFRCVGENGKIKNHKDSKQRRHFRSADDILESLWCMTNSKKYRSKKNFRSG